MLACVLLLTQSQTAPPARDQFTDESAAFGNVVSPAGDQDGDGVPDFILGELRFNFAEGVDESGLDCWLISGRDGSTLGWYRVCSGLDDDACEFPSTCAVRDSIVFTVPSAGGEGCRIALVDGISGCESWHSSAYRGEGGRLRAHLLPISSTAAFCSPSLDLALLCSCSCVRETLNYAWTHPSGKPTGYRGILVIQDLLSRSQREFNLLSSAEPPVSDEPARGIRYRHEREQFSRAPEEWGGPSGGVTVLGDFDGDGFDEVAEGIHDRVLVESGRTGELLFALATDTKQEPLTGFGTAVANLGDIDDDGVDEFVVSEPETIFSGSVRAFSGALHQAFWIACPPFEANVDEFGSELAPVGDVDGDGVTDLIVGSWNNAAKLPGYSALLSGRTGVALLEFHRGRRGVVAAVPDRTLSWHPPH